MKSVMSSCTSAHLSLKKRDAMCWWVFDRQVNLMLYQCALRFLEARHDIKELVYLNFDDERLFGMKVEDLDFITRNTTGIMSFRGCIIITIILKWIFTYPKKDMPYRCRIHWLMRKRASVNFLHCWDFTK